MATAQVIFQRFYYSKSYVKYSIYVSDCSLRCCHHAHISNLYPNYSTFSSHDNSVSNTSLSIHVRVCLYNALPEVIKRVYHDEKVQWVFCEEQFICFSCVMSCCLHFDLMHSL